MTRAPIWFFGDAVQDITVEIDLDRLAREHGYVADRIRMAEQGVQILDGLELKTRIGLHEYSVKLRLKEDGPLSNGFYLLKPGDKYTLQGQIASSLDEATDSGLFVPCENVSWGGGGINAVTFLRAIAPDPKVVPIRYSDIAMSRGLPILLGRFDKLRDELTKRQQGSTQESIAAYLDTLYGEEPAYAELITSRIATTAAEYSADRSLEVYLASLQVEPLLYRPVEPSFRRNWIISRIKHGNREIDNKIIFRGIYTAASNQPDIAKMFEPHVDNVGAMVLNSLKNEAMFQAAYSLYQKAYAKNPNVVAILVMTEGMQRFVNWLLENRPEDRFPPFILVFNEVEAWKFAQKFSNDIEPFMSSADDFPDVRKFGKLAATLIEQFPVHNVPRIYVTLGSRGSLGIDGIGPVVYVGSFGKSGATVYDTNACGDAYCSTITLLEWAKRNAGLENIAELDQRGDQLHSAKEMIYFMAVATAVAYSKATNPRGKVYSTDVKDLLDHVHLASEILPNAFDLDRAGTQLPISVQDNRLTSPAKAELMHVKKDLNRLMGNLKASQSAAGGTDDSPG